MQLLLHGPRHQVSPLVRSSHSELTSFKARFRRTTSMTVQTYLIETPQRAVEALQAAAPSPRPSPTAPAAPSKTWQLSPPALHVVDDAFERAPKRRPSLLYSNSVTSVLSVQKPSKRNMTGNGTRKLCTYRSIDGSAARLVFAWSILRRDKHAASSAVTLILVMHISTPTILRPAKSDPSTERTISGNIYDSCTIRVFSTGLPKPGKRPSPNSSPAVVFVKPGSNPGQIGLNTSLITSKWARPWLTGLAIGGLTMRLEIVLKTPSHLVSISNATFEAN